jgi:glycosyltransferase involved in cell wall biosynthesis
LAGVDGCSRGSPSRAAIAGGPSSPFRLSIIVPVYNNPQDLRECLAALRALSCSGSEIIVVDDASTDDTPSVAAQMGVRVLQLSKNSGAAAARNYGANHARGDILFFVDADVVVAPNAPRRVVEVFATRPDLAAVFGSYDAQPRAGGVISQYRNLLHHFVHQTASPEASTFWAGCGAIRRSVFQELGGFDAERFPRPSIEDIELGYRLRQAGHRILLDKALQATHLKRWTLRSLIRTDIFHRAIPWSRLILQSKKVPDDLNLKRGQRLCVALVGFATICLLLAVFRLELLILWAAALLGVIILNRDLFAFFFRQHGPFFATICIPFHLLHYFFGGLSYLYVWISFRLRGVTTHSPTPTQRGNAWSGRDGKSEPAVALSNSIKSVEKGPHNGGG